MYNQYKKGISEIETLLEEMDTITTLEKDVIYRTYGLHLKQHTINLIEGEIKRLEGEKKGEYMNIGYDDFYRVTEIEGYNQGLQDQISHFQSELKLFKEDK